jgi:hypothetical protein
LLLHAAWFGPEDEGSTVVRNAGIQPYYTAQELAQELSELSLELETRDNKHMSQMLYRNCVLKKHRAAESHKRGKFYRAYKNQQRESRRDILTNEVGGDAVPDAATEQLLCTRNILLQTYRGSKSVPVNYFKHFNERRRPKIVTGNFTQTMT